MFMWYADGRMREYEAWSCDDVDSVHNDYQVGDEIGGGGREGGREGEREGEREN
jgi:hypothetical protein